VELITWQQRTIRLKEVVVNMVDDVTFVNDIDIEVGKLYSEAKVTLSRDVPQHTLTLSRSVSHMICKKIAKHNGIDLPNDNLAENISILANHNIINNSMKDAFHQLRVLGNKGAHPEEYKQSHKEFVEEAEQALGLCCELVSDYKLNFFGGSIPKYQYQKVDSDSKDKELKNLAYKASIQGEEKSLFEMGMYLKKKHDELLELVESGKDTASAMQLGFAREQFMSCLNLSAIQQYPPALYENGCAQLSQTTGNDKEKGVSALNDIKYAAELGHIESIFLIGSFQYIGVKELDFPQDKEAAVSNLKIAADNDHPQALTMLSDYFIDKKDYKKAKEMLFRAVEAGYPLAKVRLAEAYMKNQWPCNDRDEVEEWLRSIDGSIVPEAQFTLAKWLLEYKISPENMDLALSIFKNYEYKNDELDFRYLNEAADILFKKPFDDNALPVATMLAYEAYQRSEDPSIARKIAFERACKIGRRVIRILRLGEASPRLVQQLTQLRVFFDDKGKPLASKR
jgi:TPR repeat protein